MDNKDVTAYDRLVVVGKPKTPVGRARKRMRSVCKSILSTSGTITVTQKGQTVTLQEAEPSNQIILNKTEGIEAGFIVTGVNVATAGDDAKRRVVSVCKETSIVELTCATAEFVEAGTELMFTGVPVLDHMDSSVFKNEGVQRISEKVWTFQTLPDKPLRS